MRHSPNRVAVIAAVAALVTTAGALAVPTVDGTLDAEYGTPLSLQVPGTQFGDYTGGGAGLQAFGSELDAGYAVISGGKLHLFLAGNLETNFNKLDIFIDSKAGGQNQLRGNNPDVEFNNLNRMGDEGTGNGLKFDAGFEADHFFTLTAGNLPVEMYSSYADIRTLGGGNGTYIGTNGGGDNPVLDARVNGDGANPLLGIQWGLNNANTQGVGPFGTPNVSDPATVTTGIELSIPLTYLEDPTGPIKIVAFINGLNHDFLSNQVLGPLPLESGNLGEPRAVDFGALAGDQFLTVANASTYNQWGTSTSGNYSDTGKWTGGIAPTDVSSSALFGAGPAGPVSVNVDVAAVVNRLVMNGPNYTLSGAGSLTIGGLNFAAVSVASGSHTVGVPVTLAKNVQFDIGAGASLALTGTVDYAQKYVEKVGDGSLTVPNVRTSAFAVYGGSLKISGSAYSAANTVIVGSGANLDLGTSPLLVEYDPEVATSPLADLVAAIADARITSSAVTSNARAIGYADTAQFPALTSYDGQPLDGSAVVLVATLKGDTNLDKTVNFDDLLALAQSYNGTSPLTWTQGDTNLDGAVNFDDLLALAQNYGASALADGGVSIDQQLAANFHSDWAFALSIVPEPASVSLLALGALAVRRRR